MYDHAYPHPEIVHAEGEPGIGYEPNVERDVRNEMGE